MGRTEKPWTWRQIAALEGTALRAFCKAYGDRGRVARLIATREGRPKGKLMQWVPCPINLDAGSCPVLSDRWRVEERERGMSCLDRAPLVYARMVAKLGRMPEERKQ